MSISAESATLFTARRKGKSGWEYEFNPRISEIERVRHIVRHYYKESVFVSTTNNCNLLTPDSDYFTYNSVVEAGKSYMVGEDVPTKKYIASHSTYIEPHSWLAFAIDWAFNNPESMMSVDIQSRNSYYYQVYKRGEYVEIALPHHGRGGEKHWIVPSERRNRRLLVNVD